MRCPSTRRTAADDARVSELHDIVVGLFRRGAVPDLPYHNLRHTLEVHDTALKLAEQYLNTGELSMEQVSLLRIAALFHDTGFANRGRYANNEPVGATNASRIMARMDYNAAERDTVKRLIRATAMPQRPTNVLERILCDADLGYLGAPGFLKVLDGLRREWEDIGRIYAERRWLDLNIIFLRAHRYHTAAARKAFDKAKVENLGILEMLKRELGSRERIQDAFTRLQ